MQFSIGANIHCSVPGLHAQLGRCIERGWLDLLVRQDLHSFQQVLPGCYCESRFHDLLFPLDLNFLIRFAGHG